MCSTTVQDYLYSMKKALLFFLLLPCLTFAQSYTVETVPNTKLVNNSYVSNPDGIISETTVAQINSILDSLEKKTTAQVSVVVLQSIGGQDIFDFAQQLFVKWGIGQAGNDNGLLVLFVMDQHTVRFHTGYGLEAVLTDATCKDIQREYMVPSFKEGNYDEGMLNGISKTAEVLTNPAAAAEIINTEINKEEDYYIFFLLMIVLLPVLIITFFVARSYRRFKPSREASWIGMSVWRWLILYVVLPYALLFIAYNGEWKLTSFLLATYGLLVFLLLEKRIRIHHLATPHLKAGSNQWLWNFYRPQKTGLIFAALFFPVPMLFIYFLYRRNLYRYRDMPRTCKQCGGTCVKLSEKEEDSFLQASQIAEEKVKSVDYDVWKCTSCTAVDLLIYPSSSTKYTPCPKCKAITYHISKERVIKKATYSDYGSREVIHFCENCSHKARATFTIPILVASTSSDSSSSSSGSSGSSGGSWGGGSSGGGGASSSW